MLIPPGHAYSLNTGPGLDVVPYLRADTLLSGCA